MAAPKARQPNTGLITPPDGLEYASFTNGDGAAIRYASAKPPEHALVDGKPTGVVVLVTGFRESIERYYERIREHQERGEVVYTMDWRGQGGSQRYNSSLPQRPGAQGYEHDVADLDQFVTEVAQIEKNHPGIPKTLHAHSMGGNIALRYLHDKPGRFDNAVITSPMLGINTGKSPKWLAKVAAKAIKFVSKHGEYGYMPGEKDWTEDTPLNPLSKAAKGRVMRLTLQDHFYRHIPEIRTGGATARWFLEACRSVKILEDPAYLRAIKTPVMLVVGERDDTVKPEAIIRAAKYLPNARLHRYKHVGHSPWMEKNAVREKLWGQVNDFLRDYRAGARTLSEPPRPDRKPRHAIWSLAKRLTSGPDSKPGQNADWEAASPRQSPVVANAAHDQTGRASQAEASQRRRGLGA